MTVLPRGPRASRRSIRSSWVGGVDAGDGLVEQEQVGLRGDRPGQEHPPPLAAGQPTDLGRAVVGHADLLERLVDRGPIVRGRDGGAARAPEAAHHHDVLDRDREGPVDELGLGDVGDPPGLPAGRPPRTSIRPVHGCSRPGHQLEERALAGAVRTDDGEQACPARPPDRHVLQGEAVVVAGGDVGEPDGGVRPRVLGIGDGAVLEGRQLTLVGMAVGMLVRVERGGHGWSAPTTRSDVPADDPLVTCGGPPRESV